MIVFAKIKCIDRTGVNAKVRKKNLVGITICI